MTFLLKPTASILSLVMVLATFTTLASDNPEEAYAVKEPKQQVNAPKSTGWDIEFNEEAFLDDPRNEHKDVLAYPDAELEYEYTDTQLKFNEEAESAYALRGADQEPTPWTNGPKSIDKRLEFNEIVRKAQENFIFWTIHSISKAEELFLEACQSLRNSFASYQKGKWRYEFAAAETVYTFLQHLYYERKGFPSNGIGDLPMLARISGNLREGELFALYYNPPYKSPSYKRAEVWGEMPPYQRYSLAKSTLMTNYNHALNRRHAEVEEVEITRTSLNRLLIEVNNLRDLREFSVEEVKKECQRLQNLFNNTLYWRAHSFPYAHVTTQIYHRELSSDVFPRFLLLSGSTNVKEYFWGGDLKDESYVQFVYQNYAIEEGSLLSFREKIYLWGQIICIANDLDTLTEQERLVTADPLMAQKVDQNDETFNEYFDRLIRDGVDSGTSIIDGDFQSVRAIGPWDFNECWRRYQWEVASQPEFYVNILLAIARVKTRVPPHEIYMTPNYDGQFNEANRMPWEDQINEIYADMIKRFPSYLHDDLPSEITTELSDEHKAVYFFKETQRNLPEPVMNIVIKHIN